MKIEGKIKKLDKIIVSDPSYTEEVTCRYERKNLNKKDWQFEMIIKDVQEECKGYTVEGIEFSIYMYMAKGMYKLNELSKFTHPKGIKFNETVIGMDTACISLGVNKYADEIKNSKEECKPSCSLRTTEDGVFGNVIEGRINNNINCIYINGYLSDYACYTLEEIATYILEQFEVIDVEKIIDNNIEKEELLEY